MQIYYRLSDGSYPKVRFEKATKENCLCNFLSKFNEPGDNMLLLLDNVKDETYEKFSIIASRYNGFSTGFVDYNITVRRSFAGSSAASFRLVFEEALKLDEEEQVYFVEDDYIHLYKSRATLVEGLQRAPYVTLYNHPDKYIPASKGGNPLVGDDGAEKTKVFVTPGSYWMMTNSTTMTFASHVSVLKKDADIWLKHTEGTYPFDMQIFLELRHKGRGLIQPIPSKATHAMPEWAAHLHGTGLHNWEEAL